MQFQSHEKINGKADQLGAGRNPALYMHVSAELQLNLAALLSGTQNLATDLHPSINCAGTERLEAYFQPIYLRNELVDEIRR